MAETTRSAAIEISRGIYMSADNGRGFPWPPESADPRDRMSEFAGYIVNRLFSVGLKLESAGSVVGDGPARDPLRAATGEIDQLINEIRGAAFNPTADRWMGLKEHMAFAAREVQARALDAAARLERPANFVRQPSRLDHGAEIERWQAFADQADQMAKRWERS